MQLPTMQPRIFAAGTVIAWPILWFAVSLTSVAGALSLCSGAFAADDAMLAKGAAIYKQKCAACHGANGEGVEDEYDEPLRGDLSLPELTEVISDTMPEADPDQCTGPDAAAVAAYIEKKFYRTPLSADAPTARLQRLTATQLRQSLAGLYARFDGVLPVMKERGLSGEYYRTTRIRKSNLKTKRVDAVLDFDFGNKGPGDGIDPEEFSIIWRGGLKVDVSGDYEFIVNSHSAFVMKFGLREQELINNHTQSGDKTEFRRKLHLTAGRIYPLEVVLFQRKRKTKQPPANFTLAWKPPYGVEEVIPTSHLLPNAWHSAFALQAKLPPDDRSYGFERGIAIDRQWDNSTTAAALEFGELMAEYVWPRHIRRLRIADKDRRAKLRELLLEFVETALRGPADEATKKLYIDDQLAATADDSDAIRRCVLITLKSPRFLYPLLDSHRSVSQRVANRLTLTLYDSLPVERWMLEQIAKDQLSNAQNIRHAAGRMVNDYRTQAKTRELMYQWLNMEHLHLEGKDAEKFPGFSQELQSDLRRSLDKQIDEILWSDASDFRQFFTADWAYTTPRMAAYYGDAWKPAGGEKDKASEKIEQPLLRTAGDSSVRTGIISHPYLMSGLAYNRTTSPIHRGVFLNRYVLGRTIRPPSEAFTPLSPDLHPDLTTRERVSLQTSPAGCQVCHSRINGLGFTLENFDATGRYRKNDGAKPVDSTGTYMTTAGKEVTFKDAPQLVAYLASSEDAIEAFVLRAFQHFVKQPPAAFGEDTLARLTNQFKADGYSVRKLIVEIAVVAAMEPVTAADKTASAKKD